MQFNVLIQNVNKDHYNLCGPHIAKLRSNFRPPLTQEDLAARLQANGLDIDRATIAKIETQKRRFYDYEIIAFAKALKVKPAVLIEAI